MFSFYLHNFSYAGPRCISVIDADAVTDDWSTLIQDQTLFYVFLLILTRNNWEKSNNKFSSIENWIVNQITITVIYYQHQYTNSFIASYPFLWIFLSTRWYLSKFIDP